jgi:hypothetical protein
LGFFASEIIALKNLKLAKLCAKLAWKLSAANLLPEKSNDVPYLLNP